MNKKYEYSLIIRYPEEKITTLEAIKWFRETANRVETFTKFMKAYNESISVKFEDSIIVIDNFVEE